MENPVVIRIRPTIVRAHGAGATSVTTAGVFTLSSPRDLFEKLRHDVEVIKINPTDPYAAYNFVVTAEHMLDWIYPGSTNKKTRETLRNSDPLLALISHLASGAKHFASLSPHHQSVNNRGGEIFNAPIVTSAARGSRVIYPTGSHLIVYLDGKAKAKYGPFIKVVDLAVAACEYWSKDSSVQPNTYAP